MTSFVSDLIILATKIQEDISGEYGASKFSSIKLEKYANIVVSAHLCNMLPTHSL